MDDDDFQLNSYQDDLATDDNATDPLMDETGDDPTEDLGVPPAAFKEELDKVAVDENDGNLPDDIDIRDDEREYFEDIDENNDDAY